MPLSTEVYVNINTSPNIIDSSDVINDVNVHQATSSYQSSDIHSDLDSGKLTPDLIIGTFLLCLKNIHKSFLAFGSEGN